MRMSWVGFQLLLSCTLLLGLAAFGVEGKCCKRGEPSAEEECCRKRHPCVEDECCKKRHPCVEDECCRKRHPCVEDECCRKRHPCVEDECCKKRHPCVEESEESEESEDLKEAKELKEAEQVEQAEESAEAKWEKEMARMQQKGIAILAAQSPEVVPHYLKEKAIHHYNHLNSGPLYKHLEGSQFEIKKAIGVMVYIKVALVKTNCSKGKEQEGGVEYSRDYLENKGCQPLPESKQEKHDCTFDIFIDTKSGTKTVTGYKCITLPRSEEPSNTLEAH